MKLYRSTKDNRWFARDPEIGWVRFPAEVGGWEKRQPSRAKDRIDIQEVPLGMGFNTGIPGAPMWAGGAWDLPFQVIGVRQHSRKTNEIKSLTLRRTGRVDRCRSQTADSPPLPKSA